MEHKETLRSNTLDFYKKVQVWGRMVRILNSTHTKGHPKKMMLALPCSKKEEKKMKRKKEKKREKKRKGRRILLL
jgi:hypothetical protein